MLAIVGCDPGVTGGLSLIIHGKLTAIFDMPVVEEAGKKKLDYNEDGTPVEKIGVSHSVDPYGVKRILTNWRDMAFVKDLPVRLVIEKMWSRKGQASTSNDKLIYGAGLVTGIALGLGFDVKTVAPATWKSKMKVTADKGTSLQLARQVVQGQHEWVGVFRRKKDNGRAEAFLIGLWGHIDAHK